MTQANKIQMMNTMATIRNMRERNCSSAYWVDPGGANCGRNGFFLNREIIIYNSGIDLRAGNRVSLLKLKVDAKKLNGKAPIPNETWRPSNPNPNRLLGRGASVRCPWGLGGIFSRGSCRSVLLRPYKGITFSLLIADLHTGHVCELGRVSSHLWRHGQQNKWPHMEMTASRATSKHMLHSYWEFGFSLADDDDDCFSFDWSSVRAILSYSKRNQNLFLISLIFIYWNDFFLFGLFLKEDAYKKNFFLGWIMCKFADLRL